MTPPPRPSVHTDPMRCTACGDTKPLADFKRHPGTVSGRTQPCAACQRLKLAGHMRAARTAGQWHA